MVLIFNLNLTTTHSGIKDCRCVNDMHVKILKIVILIRHIIEASGMCQRPITCVSMSNTYQTLHTTISKSVETSKYKSKLLFYV